MRRWNPGQRLHVVSVSQSFQLFRFSDSSGPATDGTEAIKRITQDAEHWIFQSDNPAYDPIRIPKNEIAHPILGTLVEKL